MHLKENTLVDLKLGAKSSASVSCDICNCIFVLLGTTVLEKNTLSNIDLEGVKVT